MSATECGAVCDFARDLDCGPLVCDLPVHPATVQHECTDVDGDRVVWSAR